MDPCFLQQLLSGVTPTAPSLALSPMLLFASSNNWCGVLERILLDMTPDAKPVFLHELSNVCPCPLFLNRLLSENPGMEHALKLKPPVTGGIPGVPLFSPTTISGRLRHEREAVDQHGRTAMWYAANTGMTPHLLLFLLIPGTERDTRGGYNNEWLSPFELLCRTGSLRCAQMMHGFHPDAMTLDAYRHCLRSGSVPIVEWASTIRPPEWNEALGFAVRNECSDCVLQWLLVRSAVPNARFQGLSLLEIAVSTYSMRIVRLLTSFGADGGDAVLKLARVLQGDRPVTLGLPVESDIELLFDLLLSSTNVRGIDTTNTLVKYHVQRHFQRLQRKRTRD